MIQAEYNLVINASELDPIRAAYERKNIPFSYGLDYALEKATQGIRNPKARDIITDVSKYLLEYLSDTLLETLPTAKTAAGKVIRWILKTFTSYGRF